MPQSVCKNYLDVSGKKGGSSGSEKKQWGVALSSGHKGENRGAQVIYQGQARSCWKS